MYTIDKISKTIMIEKGVSHENMEKIKKLEGIVLSEAFELGSFNGIPSKKFSYSEAKVLDKKPEGK